MAVYYRSLLAAILLGTALSIGSGVLLIHQH
jgi:hypothetical protein